MVTTEVDRMLQEFEQRLSSQGMNLELYFQFSGQDEAALRGQMKEDAGKRVRTNLTLEAIAVAENITFTDEDVENELSSMTEQFNMSVDQIKAALGGSTEVLGNDLRIKKAIDFLVENSKPVA